MPFSDRYFLVKGEVTQTPYGHGPQRFDDMRLVIAESEEQACEKYRAWWSDASEEYGVYYYAGSIVVLETIE